MSVKLFITIDIEEDNWGDFRPTGHTVENVARIPMLQEIFERYGAIPTYLLNYPVLKNESSAGMISLKRTAARSALTVIRGTLRHSERK
jgi:hypothetical protein